MLRCVGLYAFVLLSSCASVVAMMPPAELLAQRNILWVQHGSQSSSWSCFGKDHKFLKACFAYYEPKIEQTIINSTSKGDPVAGYTQLAGKVRTSIQAVIEDFQLRLASAPVEQVEFYILLIFIDKVVRVSSIATVLQAINEHLSGQNNDCYEQAYQLLLNDLKNQEEKLEKDRLTIVESLEGIRSQFIKMREHCATRQEMLRSVNG